MLTVMENACIVCFELDDNLQPIRLKDEQHLTIKEKLHTLVPEIRWEDVEDDSKICLFCLQQLEQFCAFRDQCIVSFFRCQNKENEQIKNEPLDREGEKEEEFVGFHTQTKDGNEEEEHGIQSFLSCQLQENDQSLVSRQLQENDNIKKKLPDNENGRKEEFTCRHCEQKFVLKRNLTKHINLKHSKSKKVKCNLCEKLVVKSSLKAHKYRCAKNDNMLKCEVCGNNFRGKRLLNKHLTNVHKAEKHFKCELCDKKLYSLAFLNRHKNMCHFSERKERKERKYMCPLCGKDFNTSSDCSKHKKIHENERAYSCDICGKSFNTGNVLRYHKKGVHLDSSLWKYDCSICHKKFPVKYRLVSHMMVHEKDEVVKFNNTGVHFLL